MGISNKRASIYADTDVELVGFTTSDGCPGGNIEYSGDEMTKNGAQVIHLATGLVVGYPPCPHIGTFKAFLENRYGIKVVVGTHPIPEKYRLVHIELPSWPILEKNDPLMATEAVRKAYD